MFKIIKEYITALGYWGFLVIAPIILDVLGVIQLITNKQVFILPSWLWFQVSFLFLLVIPFIAFYKIRIHVEKISDDRSRELARLILQVRDAAGKVVLHHMGKGITDEVKELHSKCNEELSLLNREGEVDGVEVKKIVYEYTTFVSLHVSRLLGAFSVVIGGPEKDSIQRMDEYSFCGLMADRADKTIQEIRKTLRK